MSKEAGIDFNHYAMMVFRYIAQEYDLTSTEDQPVVLYLDPAGIDFVRTQWMTCQPIPNTAGELIKKIKR